MSVLLIETSPIIMFYIGKLILQQIGCRYQYLKVGADGMSDLYQPDIQMPTIYWITLLSSIKGK